MNSQLSRNVQIVLWTIRICNSWLAVWRITVQSTKSRTYVNFSSISTISIKIDSMNYSDNNLKIKRKKEKVVYSISTILRQAYRLKKLVHPSLTITRLMYHWSPIKSTRIMKKLINQCCNAFPDNYELIIVRMMTYREDSILNPWIFVKIHLRIKLIVMTLLSDGINKRSGESRRSIQRIIRKINHDDS